MEQICFEEEKDDVLRKALSSEVSGLREGDLRRRGKTRGGNQGRKMPQIERNGEIVLDKSLRE